MRLSVSAQFTLKDTPKGYRGLCGNHWNFGKDKPMTLAALVVGVVDAALEFYSRFATAQEMQESADALAKYFAGMHFTDTSNQDKKEGDKGE